MKAIMIFDFDDDWIKRNNIELNNLFGHVVIYEKDSLNEQCDYTNRRYWCFNSLKSLPNLKHPNGSDIVNDYVRGYNDCLGEILEETNG